MSSRDLFANFERMRREIDEIFGDVFERSGLASQRAFTPEVDVYYCGDPPRAIVKAAIAGVNIDDVTLEIRGRQLLLLGERHAQDAEDRLYQQIEIAQGPFRRVVELGADVDAERTSASYEAGILRIEIPLVVNDPASRRIPIDQERE